MAMNSRERVLAAVNHRQPDRVPLDLGGTSATGIEPGLYLRLRDRLNLAGEPPRVMDVWQLLAWVEQPVVDALGADCLPVPRFVQPFGMRLDAWRPWRLDDGTAVRMPANFAPVAERDGSLCLYADGQLVARRVHLLPDPQHSVRRTDRQPHDDV